MKAKGNKVNINSDTMRNLFTVVLFILLTGSQVWAQSDSLSGRIIKVLSFNVYHGATMQKNYDLDVIARVIKDADPDFVALQEVDFNTVRNGKLDLAAELGHRVKMVPLFGRSMFFDGGEYGLGILSKYSFTKTQVVPLPGTPGREPRTALAATVILPAGDTIVFVCTHLDHQIESDRIAQAEKINKEFSHIGYPVILAGDLNAKPESTTIMMLEESWLPTYDVFNPEPTFPSSAPAVKIDYVMLYPLKRWKYLKSEVIRDSVASDHCAYLVTVELIGR